MPVAPIAEHVAAAAARSQVRLSPAHWCAIAAGALVAGILLWQGVRASPLGGVKVPAATTEDIPDYTFDPPPSQPVIGPFEHVAGYVFTPHRYPHVCGHEISALINYGHATLRLPHEKDMTWLAQPPGEVSL